MVLEEEEKKRKGEEEEDKVKEVGLSITNVSHVTRARLFDSRLDSRAPHRGRCTV